MSECEKEREKGIHNHNRAVNGTRTCHSVSRVYGFFQPPSRSRDLFAVPCRPVSSAEHDASPTSAGILTRGGSCGTASTYSYCRVRGCPRHGARSVRHQPPCRDESQPSGISTDGAAVQMADFGRGPVM